VSPTTLASEDEPGPRTGWSRAAVYRIVRKRTVLGEWDADKRRGAVIAIPAILTEDEWQAASRSLLAHKKRGLRRTRFVYLLEGLATCGHCGARIHIRSACGERTLTRDRNPAAYVCRNRQLHRDCTAPIVKTAELDARVWAALCDEIEQPTLIDALADVLKARAGDAHDWKADAETHRAHLARLEKVESAIMVRFRRGQVSEAALDGELAAIGKERRMVREQLATAERAAGANMSAADRLRAAGDTLAALRSALPLATQEQRRALLRELVASEGVTITDGRALLNLHVLVSAPNATEARPRISLVGSSGYRMIGEAIGGVSLRIRRVA
jgi:hypothetical protein